MPRPGIWTALSSCLLLVPLAATAQTSPLPLQTPHPEPRVIVTVTSLKGGHDRDAVQRRAREAWGPIVRCYKDSGRREEGQLTLRLEISARGKSMGVRRLKSTLNSDVSKCVAGALAKKAMPTARNGSTATLEVWLAPGDE